MYILFIFLLSIKKYLYNTSDFNEISKIFNARVCWWAPYKATTEALVNWTNNIWLVTKTKSVQFETKYMR